MKGQFKWHKTGNDGSARLGWSSPYFDYPLVLGGVYRAASGHWEVSASALLTGTVTRVVIRKKTVELAMEELEKRAAEAFTKAAGAVVNAKR